MGKRVVIRALGVIEAVIAALVVYMATRALNVEPLVPETLAPPGEAVLVPLTVSDVALFVVIVGLAAWALAGILELMTRFGTTIWGLIATAVFLASLAGVILYEDTQPTRVSMLVTSVAVAVILIPTFIATSPHREE